MPRLNTRGDVLMGVGGGPASVNGAPLPLPAGVACWVDDDRVVVQSAPSGVFTAVVLNIRTGDVVEWTPRRPVNQLAAHLGGRYVAADQVGVFGDVIAEGFALGLTDQDGRGGAASDGTLAIVRHGGLGFQLHAPGSIVEGPPVLARDLCVISRTSAIWRDDGGRIGAFGIAAPVQVPAATMLRYVAVPGQTPWLVCFDPSRGLIAHPWDSLVGVQLSQPGQQTFYPDARVINGQLRVVWANGQGELPGDAVVVHDAFALQRVDFAAPAPVEPIVPINHPMWLGFYVGDPQGPDGWHTTMPKTWPPGNAYLDVFRKGFYAKDGRLIAKFIHGFAADGVESVEAQAQANLPLSSLCYWDGMAWPRDPNLPPGAYKCAQAYKLADETLAACEARIEAEIVATETRQPHLIPAIVPQCYTSKAELEQDLVALVPMFARLAQRHPRLAVMAPFSGTGRQTGLWQHPDAIGPWNQLFAGVTGEPPSSEVPPVEENGIVDGVCVDPKAYFFSLIGSAEGRPVGDWRATFNRSDVIAGLELYGFGQQRRTPSQPAEGPNDTEPKGDPSSRLFVPTAVCANAKPRPGLTTIINGHPYTEIQLGVNQTPPCWEGFVDTIDNATQTWTWRPSGLPYAPLPPPDPNPPDPVDPPGVFLQIIDYPATFSRRSNRGFHLEYEADSQAKIIARVAGLNDGGRLFAVNYRNQPNDADGRYDRGVTWKPGVNGQWRPFVEVTDANGIVKRVEGEHLVTVTE